jgi:3-hydroxybutyrate dehydrogenase
MNKTVLITGATSGIGKAIAIAFAKEGYAIAFNSIDPEGESIARAIALEYKITHIYFPVDIRDRKACRDMVQTITEKLGPVSVLINNAGIQFVSPIDEFPDEKWDAIMDINLGAAFQLIKAVWPAMKAQTFGRIINIASAHGIVASPFKSAYVASKHAMIGLTKAIALEGAAFGITCNAVCPGFVHTAIIDKQIEAMMKAHQLSKEEVVQHKMLEKQAIKEFIPAELIAQTTMLLADKNANTLTGAVIPVDGGWTAQ